MNLTPVHKRRLVAIATLLAAAGFLLLQEFDRYGARDRTPGAVPDLTAGATPRATANFDYYLMALSWSPSYCATHPDEVEQCGRKGFGFILHGLWPQFQRGYGPRECGGRAAPDAATVERMLAIMPSRRLIRHEWDAHGTCSGMAPAEYFDRAERAHASVRVPQALTTPSQPPNLTAQQVLTGFTQANPGLPMNALSVRCSGRELSEVRVCLSLALMPRACGSKVDSNCPTGILRIPAVR